MPIRWMCPANPKCQKSFTFATSLKAHMRACKHAKGLDMTPARQNFDTMVTIVEFAESQQKGNVTLARKGVHTYRKLYTEELR